MKVNTTNMGNNNWAHVVTEIGPGTDNVSKLRKLVYKGTFYNYNMNINMNMI